MVGAMTPFLLKTAPSDDDHKHPLRSVLMVPLGEDTQDFAERFNVDVFTTFNMIEVSSPIMSEKSPSRMGVAGKARTGVELRIVDEFDQELPTGAMENSSCAPIRHSR